MTSSRPRPRAADLSALALGVALTSVSYALFRGLGRDHALYGIPALVMLVLLCLNALKPPQSRSYSYFLAGALVTALVLRLIIGTPL